MNEPIAVALSALRSVFAGLGHDAPRPTGVIDELSQKALWALANAGDLDRCTPRLVELLITGELEVVEPWEVTGLFARDGWPTWSVAQRRAVLECGDAWWATLIQIHPLPPGVDAVLGSLALFDEPLVRWLQPLLVGLDGAGALHLADLAIGGLDSSAWDQQPDRRGQVLGWLASEPVILGLTLVGGVHLDDGQLGAALDVMLGLEPDPQ